MTDKPNKPFNLNMHTARLLMREPFFAALSRRIDKIASTAIPTAGVRVNPDSAQFEIMYNPEFMASLSDTSTSKVSLCMSSTTLYLRARDRPQACRWPQADR